MRVLDVGCGPGHLTCELEPRCEVVGFDISNEMLARARKRCPSALYLWHDFHARLPRALGKFDAILASGCFESCRDLGQVFSNLAEPLRDGGNFFFSVAERRPELPYQHDRSSVLSKPPDPEVVAYFWTRTEVSEALSRTRLREASYSFGDGWASKTTGFRIQYAYWEVQKD
jgi:SAM-dependent methyltransferase